jgi:hypothetical protein|tara:strand:- start:858 stop:1205 length:348 start_codon:yes stop_codon:yes gene_type:complete
VGLDWWIYFGFWNFNCSLAKERKIMEILRDYGLIFISFVLSMIYAIEPLFMSKLVNINKSDDQKSLKRKKVMIYRQIKELEMEHDIGNINDKDFTEMRDELKKEVSELISQIKSE